MDRDEDENEDEGLRVEGKVGVNLLRSVPFHTYLEKLLLASHSTHSFRFLIASCITVIIGSQGNVERSRLDKRNNLKLSSPTGAKSAQFKLFGG